MDERDEEALKWASKAIPKLLSLFDRYGIEPPNEWGGAWFDLAMSLAAEHESHIRVPKKPGAPRSELVRDAMIVAALGANRPAGTSINAAAVHLSKKPMFTGNSEFKKKSASSIRTRYYVLIDPKSSENQRLREFLALAIESDDARDAAEGK